MGPPILPNMLALNGQRSRFRIDRATYSVQLLCANGNFNARFGAYAFTHQKKFEEKWIGRFVWDVNISWSRSRTPSVKRSLHFSVKHFAYVTMKVLEIAEPAVFLSERQTFAPQEMRMRRDIDRSPTLFTFMTCRREGKF